jgi:hypothetical protein
MAENHVQLREHVGWCFRQNVAFQGVCAGSISVEPSIFYNISVRPQGALQRSPVPAAEKWALKRPRLCHRRH